MKLNKHTWHSILFQYHPRTDIYRKEHNLQKLSGERSLSSESANITVKAYSSWHLAAAPGLRRTFPNPSHSPESLSIGRPTTPTDESTATQLLKSKL